MRFRKLHPAPVLICIAATSLPHTVYAGSEIIDGWTDALLSASRLVIVGASFLGLAYAAISLVRAYKVDVDAQRTRHLLAALFSGTFTIIGVIIGWISGLLIPGAG